MPGEGGPDTLVLLSNNANLQGPMYLKGFFLALVFGPSLISYRSRARELTQFTVPGRLGWDGWTTVRREPGCSSQSQGTMLMWVGAKTTTGLGWWFPSADWLAQKFVYKFLFREEVLDAWVTVWMTTGCPGRLRRGGLRPLPRQQL
jgi:hypothetical protein